MRGSSPSLSPPELGIVGQPPCRPPLEIIKHDAAWLVREYHLQQDDATVFETHPARLDAMRAAKERMEEACHPCLLRWDDHNIVGDLYWNELFEELHLEYSDLLDAWVIVPGSDHYVFHSGETLTAMTTAARAVQRQYDFKHLTVYDRHGAQRDSVDHRFLRYDIAASGVRFNRDRPFRTPSELPSESEATEADPTPDEQPTGMAASSLMAAIPDLSSLREIDVSGPVLQYRATWESDGRARIALLEPDLATYRDIVQQFTWIIDDWQTLSDTATVSTVLAAGPSPAAWIAYRAGEGTFADCLADLSRSDRLGLFADVATAVETAHEHGIHRTEITPRTIRVVSQGAHLRASLAGWGLKRVVATALNDTLVTPYTAPEQLAGRVAPTTGIYQLGALAYHILCDEPPFSDAADLAGAIRSGEPTGPSSVADVPRSVDTVIRRAMARSADQRYSAVQQFTDRLGAALRES